MISVNKKIKTNASRVASISEQYIKEYYDVGFWYGGLDIISQRDAVKHMILSWCKTNRGERCFDYEYGNDLWQYIKKDVKSFINSFNPETWYLKCELQVGCITIIREKSSIAFDKQKNAIVIHLTYDVTDTDITDEIDLDRVLDGVDAY